MFLDINMPGLTGLEFAKSLTAKSLIVFTTAYSEYAAESYEVDAIDYLIKPIEPKRFAHAVDKAIAYHDTLLYAREDAAQETPHPVPAADCFFVKADRRNYRVYFRDILFIEGLKDYVIIQLADKRLLTHMNLSTISPMLPTDNFMRVSKSYIVNLDRIDSFDNNDIYIGDHIVPIGPAYRTQLASALLG